MFRIKKWSALLPQQKTSFWLSLGWQCRKVINLCSACLPCSVTVLLQWLRACPVSRERLWFVKNSLTTSSLPNCRLNVLTPVKSPAVIGWQMMGRVSSKKCNSFETQKLNPHYFVRVTCLGFVWNTFTHLIYVQEWLLSLDSQFILHVGSWRKSGKWKRFQLGFMKSLPSCKGHFVGLPICQLALNLEVSNSDSSHHLSAQRGAALCDDDVLTAL